MRYDIIIKGFILSPPQPPFRGLMMAFGIDAPTAKRILAKFPCVVKRGVSLEEAQHFESALTAIGARVELQPEQPLPTAVVAARDFAATMLQLPDEVAVQLRFLAPSPKPNDAAPVTSDQSGVPDVQQHVPFDLPFDAPFSAPEPRQSLPNLDDDVADLLSRDVFDAVVQKAPAVALSVARTLAERVQRLTSGTEIRWMSLAGKKPDRRLLSTVSDPVMRQLRAAPIDADKHTVTIGMVDPQDGIALQTFQRAFACSDHRAASCE